MEAIKDKVLSWAAYGDSSEKLGFIKCFLSCLSCEELKHVKSICTKTAAKKVNKAKSWIGPPHVKQDKNTQYQVAGKNLEASSISNDVTALPSGTVTPSLGWWEAFGENVVALDVEKVQIKNLETNKWDQKAATVSIVNHDGSVVYEDSVFHADGSFPVNKHTLRANGFKSNSLIGGRRMDIVVDQVKHHLKDKVVVGVALENDLRSLELNCSDYTCYDLQKFYRRQSPTNPLDDTPMNLRDMYFFHFKKDIQRGAHSAGVDAKATMRIFQFGYKKLFDKQIMIFDNSDLTTPNLLKLEKKNEFYCNSIKEFGEKCGCCNK